MMRLDFAYNTLTNLAGYIVATIGRVYVITQNLISILISKSFIISKSISKSLK